MAKQARCLEVVNATFVIISWRVEQNPSFEEINVSELISMKSETLFELFIRKKIKVILKWKMCYPLSFEYKVVNTSLKMSIRFIFLN